MIGDNINNLVDIVFFAMPSHIEIIEPSEFRIKNSEFSNLLSGLTAKLHRYDEIAKQITLERNILINKLQEMQKRLNQLEGKSEDSEDDVKIIEEKSEEPKDKNTN